MQAMTTKLAMLALLALENWGGIMPVLAICNQKGGVGKTSTTLNLAASLARSNQSVLIVDADSQANATDALGVEVNESTLTLNDALVAVANDAQADGIAAETIVSTSWEGIDLVPSERKLASREMDTSLGRERLMGRALEGLENKYQWILIDCPPALGPLSIGALTAADGALIVTQPRAFSVAGVLEIVNTINAVKQYYNTGLEITGIILNCWRSDRLDRAVWRDALREALPGCLIEHYLPEREIVATATTNRVPVPKNEARDYVNAMDAIARELQGKLL